MNYKSYYDIGRQFIQRLILTVLLFGNFLLVLVMLICLVLVVTLTWVHFYSLDGVTGLICSMGKQENTHYADGYTDNKFRAIKVGMSMEEVESLLGVPLLATTNHKTRVVIFYVYSQPIQKGNYRERGVEFWDNVVYEIQHEYWVD